MVNGISGAIGIDICVMAVGLAVTMAPVVALGGTPLWLRIVGIARVCRRVSTPPPGGGPVVAGVPVLAAAIRHVAVAGGWRRRKGHRLRHRLRHIKHAQRRPERLGGGYCASGVRSLTMQHGGQWRRSTGATTVAIRAPADEPRHQRRARVRRRVGRVGDRRQADRFLGHRLADGRTFRAPASRIRSAASGRFTQQYARSGLIPALVSRPQNIRSAILRRYFLLRFLRFSILHSN